MSDEEKIRVVLTFEELDVIVNSLCLRTVSERQQGIEQGDSVAHKMLVRFLQLQKRLDAGGEDRYAEV